MYAAKRLVQIKSFAVIVMDGGNNFIGALDVDQLGTAVRRDLATTVHGDSNRKGIRYAWTPGGAAVVGEGTWFADVTVSSRRTTLGEGVIDDLQILFE